MHKMKSICVSFFGTPHTHAFAGEIKLSLIVFYETQAMDLTEITQRIKADGDLTRTEASELLRLTDREPLYEAAHCITAHFAPTLFDTCSIVNVKSGRCPEDCKWCAQSAHYQTGVDEYGALEVQECVRQAAFNRRQGVGRFSLVAGGRRPTAADMDRYVESYETIHREVPDIKLCASLGLCTEGQLRRLWEAGVTTYHCNMESAPDFFGTLCTTHTQRQKEETLAAARRVGMRICSGGIIGMGESAEQRIDFAFYLRRIGSLSIPINILQPIPGTPLQDTPPLTEDEYLTAVALFRLINPRAFLRFSGGRAQLSDKIQRKAIYIGINAAITGDMLTTIGCTTPRDMAMIAEMGKINSNDTDWETNSRSN